MLTLLKIEWLKIKKYRPVWIIFACLVVLFPIATIGCGQMFKEILKELFKGVDVGGKLVSPFDFSHVFYTSAWINNGLNVAWGMLLILMVGNEFQSKTLRQNVIDGQQRNDIITSKLLLIFIFSLVSAVLVIVSGLITGLVYSNTGFKLDVVIFKVFGISFFAAFMQMLFAMLFAFRIKRPAFAVMLYLGYTIFFENFLVHFILVGLAKWDYSKLLFTQAADELTISPITLLAPDRKPTIDPAAPWIACVIYGALILFLLYRYINRTILK